MTSTQARGDRPQRAVLGIGLVQPGFRCDIGEGAVAVVVIQRVAIDAGDKDVFISVVVVIADGDADVVAGSGQAGFFGDVGEVALAVVFEEAVVVLRRILLQSLDVGAVGEEDVELAVVVVVEDSHAAGHGFGRVALGRLIAVEPEIDGLEGEPNRAFRRLPAGADFGAGFA